MIGVGIGILDDDGCDWCGGGGPLAAVDVDDGVLFLCEWCEVKHDETSPGHGGAGQTAASESRGASTPAAGPNVDGETNEAHTDAPGNRGTAIDPEDELAAYLLRLDPALLVPCQRRYLGIDDSEVDPGDPEHVDDLCTHEDPVEGPCFARWAVEADGELLCREHADQPEPDDATLPLFGGGGS